MSHSTEKLCYYRIMLTGIDIQNYRGIRRGSLDGFGSVNLFVGPNGTGKSSLLEAIFLGAYEHSKDFYFQLPHHPVPLVCLRHNEDSFPSPDLWYGKTTHNHLTIKYRLGSKVGAFHIPGSADGSGSSAPQKVNEDAAGFFKGMKLLDIRVLLDHSNEKRWWDQLLSTRHDRNLTRVMNEVYSLNLEHFTYSGDSQKLKALFIDRDYALNIDDLGAGMRIAFRMFAAILLSKGSAVLAEEFDGYQHIGTLRPFVKTLVTLAKAADTQLFLATHNMETVRTFVQVAGGENESFDLKVFQTALSKDGEFETAVFTTAEAEALMSGGFDLRKTS